MSTALIGLGSNLDDPQAQLDRAILALSRTPGIDRLRQSARYRSTPWGVLEQPDFINAVVQVETTLEPGVLLDELIRIERDAGRTRELRWGPRTLDLDLLLYEGVQCAHPRLQLPHPRLHERAFVLVPLAELVPDWPIPGHGRVRELLARCDDTRLQRLDPAPQPE